MTWPKWLDHLNDFDGKVATLVSRKWGWWGDQLTWEVDGKQVVTNTNSSHEFKQAEPGVQARIYWHPMNFWYAKAIAIDNG